MMSHINVTNPLADRAQRDMLDEITLLRFRLEAAEKSSRAWRDELQNLIDGVVNGDCRYVITTCNEKVYFIRSDEHVEKQEAQS